MKGAGLAAIVNFGDDDWIERERSGNDTSSYMDSGGHAHGNMTDLIHFKASR